MTSAAAELLARLDVVATRLRQHAATAQSHVAGRLTDPDVGTGEQWQWGQVWAHLAEFIPYWLDQTGVVVARCDACSGEPVPFGRVKSDAGRVAAIARDRDVAVATLDARLQSHIAAAREFLQQLPETAWAARGVHSTLGVMPLATILDEFVVGHLEQHAAQLDGLAAG